MIPIRPDVPAGTRLVVFGRSQPSDYIPLPATVDDAGTIVTEWELTAEELAAVLDGGRVRLSVMYTKVNVGEPLTPLKLEIIR